MHLKQLTRAAILGIAALGLSTAASPPARDFYVVPAKGALSARVAAFVSDQLLAKGYRVAATPDEADMLVNFSYRLDPYRSTATSGYYPRRRDADAGAFTNSPIPRAPIERAVDASRTDYQPGQTRLLAFDSQVEIRIVRRADNAPLFAGHAKGRNSINPSAVIPGLVGKSLADFPAAAR